jgi:hypothetical protein
LIVQALLHVQIIAAAIERSGRFGFHFARDDADAPFFETAQRGEHPFQCRQPAAHMLSRLLVAREQCEQLERNDRRLPKEELDDGSVCEGMARNRFDVLELLLQPLARKALEGRI